MYRYVSNVCMCVCLSECMYRCSYAFVNAVIVVVGDCECAYAASLKNNVFYESSYLVCFCFCVSCTGILCKGYVKGTVQHCLVCLFVVITSVLFNETDTFTCYVLSNLVQRTYYVVFFLNIFDFIMQQSNEQGSARSGL